MDYQIKNRRLHEVIYHRFISEDSYSDDTFAADEKLPCYKAEKITNVKSKSGDLAVSSHKLYFDGLLPMSEQDMFTVDGYKLPVLAFSRFDGLKKGTGTTVVYL